jgi:hypothetical protein
LICNIESQSQSQRSVITFEAVGRQLEEQTFDEEWKDEVVTEVKQWDKEEEREEEGRDKKEEASKMMDREVVIEEVRKAVAKLKNGKAVGEDKVVGEILKHGGQWMLESLWRLCRDVFQGEVIPTEWLKAVKIPIVKKGKGENFSDHRGVTLLSVVGKVFGRIIEARLRHFCESRGILGEWQFGFRKGRACSDALLVLSEVAESRGKQRVFAGFIDITKAYPSVWRDGMWKKLLDIGVRDKMFRVIKSLYAKCEVGVKVDGTVGEWYEEFVGVREGCVVSPLLFAIYINDLGKEVQEEGGGGVDIGGGRKVCCLMFADDVVILESSKAALQNSLNIAWRYSRRWRFSYNLGVDKSAIVVFGGKYKGERWTMGGKEVVGGGAALSLPRGESQTSGRVGI